MRRSMVCVIFVSACGAASATPRTPIPDAPSPAPVAKAPANTTGLALEPASVPISALNLRVDSPQPGDHVALAAAREYAVHWTSDHLEPDARGIDVALDANRPHRVAVNETVITLGALVPAGEEVLAGEHWLFAAPVAASGLVPAPSANSPRSAVAVRFVIGDASSKAAPSGAIWLREPGGTYNGPNSERVLFDLQLFDAEGKPISGEASLTLRGQAPGSLLFSAPFSALSLKSGDYELSASAPGFATVTRAFTVNTELGRPK